MSQYSKYPPISGGGGGSGTVTSVGISAPASLFAISGSPVTSSGILALTLTTKTANTVFAGPTTGSAATPAFRALVAADIPALGYLASINGDTTAAQLISVATTGTDFTATTAAGTTTLALPSASATARGVVTTGSQTIAGAKTFTGAISASNLSGTNTGDVTLGTANGLGIASQVLSLAAATTSAAGAMSAADKTRLDGLNNIGLHLYWQDDFDASAITGTTNFASGTVGGNASQLGEMAHPGITSIFAATANVGYTVLYKAQSYLLGGGVYTMDMIIKLPLLSTTPDSYTVRLGLGDILNDMDHNNGVYFEYNDALGSGNWICKTASGAARTNTTTSIPPVANVWTHLQFVINAAATSVAYYIDGVLAGTTTTTIPTGGLATVLKITRNASTGANRAVYLDAVSLDIALTTPR